METPYPHLEAVPTVLKNVVVPRYQAAMVWVEWIYPLVWTRPAAVWLVLPCLIPAKGR